MLHRTHTHTHILSLCRFELTIMLQYLNVTAVLRHLCVTSTIFVISFLLHCFDFCVVVFFSPLSCFLSFFVFCFVLIFFYPRNSNKSIFVFILQFALFLSIRQLFILIALSLTKRDSDRGIIESEREIEAKPP